MKNPVVNKTEAKFLELEKRIVRLENFRLQVKDVFLQAIGICRALSPEDKTLQEFVKAYDESQKTETSCPLCNSVKT